MAFLLLLVKDKDLHQLYLVFPITSLVTLSKEDSFLALSIFSLSPCSRHLLSVSPALISCNSLLLHLLLIKLFSIQNLFHVVLDPMISPPEAHDSGLGNLTTPLPRSHWLKNGQMTQQLANLPQHWHINSGSCSWEMMNLKDDIYLGLPALP